MRPVRCIAGGFGISQLSVLQNSQKEGSHVKALTHKDIDISVNHQNHILLVAIGGLLPFILSTNQTILNQSNPIVEKGDINKQKISKALNKLYIWVGNFFYKQTFIS